MAIIAVACSVVRAQDDHDDGPEVWYMTNFTARKCNSCMHLFVCMCARTKRTLSLTQGFPQFAVVTCGSVIKLQHVSTGYRLHSHEIKWGSGSSQQSVTAMNAMDDPNSLWQVKGAHGTHCAQGSPIKNGEVLRR